MTVAEAELADGPRTEQELAEALSSARRQVAHLEQALVTSRLIGTAIGILVERHKVTADTAFAMLVSASQNTNRKLRDLAEGLVHSGELP